MEGERFVFALGLDPFPFWWPVMWVIVRIVSYHAHATLPDRHLPLRFLMENVNMTVHCNPTVC